MPEISEVEAQIFQWLGQGNSGACWRASQSAVCILANRGTALATNEQARVGQARGIKGSAEPQTGQTSTKVSR